MKVVPRAATSGSRQICRKWQRSVETTPKSGRNRPTLLEFAKNWSSCLEHLSNSPKLADIAPQMVEVGQHWSKSLPNWPEFVKIAPRVVKIAQIWPEAQNQAGWGQPLTDELRNSPINNLGPD